MEEKKTKMCLNSIKNLIICSVKMEKKIVSMIVPIKLLERNWWNISKKLIKSILNLNNNNRMVSSSRGLLNRVRWGLRVVFWGGIVWRIRRGLLERMSLIIIWIRGRNLWINIDIRFKKIIHIYICNIFKYWK